MTRYCVAFFASLIGTLVCAFSGCGDLPFPQARQLKTNGTKTSLPVTAEETSLGDTPVTTESGDASPTPRPTTFVSRTTTNYFGEKVEPEKPTQLAVLELTIRELTFEMELKETKDPAKRAELEQEIGLLRVQRQALYEEQAKGN